jgi:DNA-binding GntR family transcriptional regulator
MVFTGELGPGDRLIQRKLAERLGVSSIPVLEATRRLERDGLVISHPNWGAQVQVWSDEDMEGAYLAREALEGIACRLFVERATDAQRAELVAFGETFRVMAERRDQEGWLESDLAIHNHIVSATRASTLIRITESSFLITLTMRGAQCRRIGQTDAYPDPHAHDALIASLLDKDPDAAEREGRSHIRNAYVKMMTRAAQAK